jgi:hypothetical protein
MELILKYQSKKVVERKSVIQYNPHFFFFCFSDAIIRVVLFRPTSALLSLFLRNYLLCCSSYF